MSFRQVFATELGLDDLQFTIEWREGNVVNGSDREGGWLEGILYEPHIIRSWNNWNKVNPMFLVCALISYAMCRKTS